MATVLFVCEHGAAKSVVAAELWQRIASEAGIALEGVARGTEPEPAMAVPAREGLLSEGIDLGERRPQAVDAEDVATAWRVVSFGPEVPGSDSSAVIVERWDDVPPVSRDYQAARAVILEHLRSLIADAAADPTVART